jgi:hypothetical protein
MNSVVFCTFHGGAGAQLIAAKTITQRAAADKANTCFAEACSLLMRRASKDGREIVAVLRGQGSKSAY